ncbi:MAG: M48 family metallopeptidase [Prevotellaceae bacterium]|jgi:predicted Zn-dependent protease|nr:M48 family metallopeptidase [Prevotellaceae bacterium]
MKTKLKNLLIMALIVAGCTTVPLTGRKQLSLVSNDDVLTSSFHQYDEYLKTASVSKDAKKTALVVKVGKRIAAAVEQYLHNNGMEDQIKEYQWDFHLIADATPNAFCMPGGKIVVYEGILPYTQDETGLAVVLGHEVAHAVAKHSNERMSQQIVVALGGEVVNTAVSKKSDLMKQLAPTIYGLGSQFAVMLPYSRSHESEADHIGLIFMAMAGYDPAQAEAFWLRMSQAGGKTPEFLSTHPSDQTRAANIRSWLPEAKKYYKTVY